MRDRRVSNDIQNSGRKMSNMQRKSGIYVSQEGRSIDNGSIGQNSTENLPKI